MYDELNQLETELSAIYELTDKKQKRIKGVEVYDQLVSLVNELDQKDPEGTKYEQERDLASRMASKLLFEVFGMPYLCSCGEELRSASSLKEHKETHA